MTDPYARPSDQPTGGDGDLTVPLVPESGYAETDSSPYVEQTLVDPAASNPWANPSTQDFGYTPTPGAGAAYARTPEPPDAGPTSPGGYPAAADYWRGPSSAAVTGQDAPTPPSSQPAYPSNYTQPQVGPSPQPTYGSSGYAQPGSSGYGQPQSSGYAQPPYGAAYAEPPQTVQPQPPFQPYPQAAPAQQTQWPAVPEPVAQEYGYSYNFAPTEHPNAIPALVLGIISLVLFPLVGPVAWYLGAKGQREMRYDPARWRPSGALSAGKILGIISTSLMALGILFFMFIIFMLAAAS